MKHKEQKRSTKEAPSWNGFWLIGTRWSCPTVDNAMIIVTFLKACLDHSYVEERGCSVVEDLT